MTSIILASMFLLNDPTGGSGPTCEEENRTIAALEAQVDEQQDTILVLEEYLFDLYLLGADSTGANSCESKTPGTEKDLCDCIAEGKGPGAGLTACLDLKAGGPLGGV